MDETRLGREDLSAPPIPDRNYMHRASSLSTNSSPPRLKSDISNGEINFSDGGEEVSDHGGEADNVPPLPEKTVRHQSVTPSSNSSPLPRSSSHTGNSGMDNLPGMQGYVQMSSLVPIPQMQDLLPRRPEAAKPVYGNGFLAPDPIAEIDATSTSTTGVSDLAVGGVRDRDMGGTLRQQNKPKRLEKVGTVRPGACIEIRDFKLYHNTVIMSTDCRLKPIIVKDTKNAEMAVIGHTKVFDPWGLSVDPTSGDIAVTDAQRSVKVFDLHGNIKVDMSDKFSRVVPLSYCARAGVYVTCDWDEKCLLLLDPRTGKVARRSLTTGGAAGSVAVDRPVYIACNPASTDMAAVNETNTCVKLFDIRGSMNMVVAELREPDPYNWAPSSVAIDKAGSVVVADPMGCRVGRFLHNRQEEWELILTIGEMKGKLWNAIDVSSSGRLAVDTTSRFNDQVISVYNGYVSMTTQGAVPNSDSESDDEGYERVINKPDPNIIDWNIPMVKSATMPRLGPPPKLEDLIPPPPAHPHDIYLTQGQRGGGTRPIPGKNLGRFLSENIPSPTLISNESGQERHSRDLPLTVRSNSLQRDRVKIYPRIEGQRRKVRKPKEGPARSKWYRDLSDDDGTSV